MIERVSVSSVVENENRFLSLSSVLFSRLGRETLAHIVLVRIVSSSRSSGYVSWSLPSAYRESVVASALWPDQRGR